MSDKLPNEIALKASLGQASRDPTLSLIYSSPPKGSIREFKMIRIKKDCILLAWRNEMPVNSRKSYLSSNLT